MRCDRRMYDIFWKLKKILNVGNESFIAYDHKIITKFVNGMTF